MGWDAELSEHYGFVVDGILFRKTIPKKRMPSKVSPSNIVGEKERIIILKVSKQLNIILPGHRFLSYFQSRQSRQIFF